VTLIARSIDGATDVCDPSDVMVSRDAPRVTLASDHDHPLRSVHLPTNRFNGGWKSCAAAREDRDRD